MSSSSFLFCVGIEELRPGIVGFLDLCRCILGEPLFSVDVILLLVLIDDVIDALDLLAELLMKSSCVLPLVPLAQYSDSSRKAPLECSVDLEGSDLFVHSENCIPAMRTQVVSLAHREEPFL